LSCKEKKGDVVAEGKEEKVMVAAKEGEVVPNPEIFGGERKLIGSQPVEVSAKEYEELKKLKDDSGNQLLVKKGGDA
jgi:hypothetical protein